MMQKNLISNSKEQGMQLPVYSNNLAFMKDIYHICIQNFIMKQALYHETSLCKCSRRLCRLTKICYEKKK